MIKAALFDLDGVVLDTETQYSVFWGMIGKEYQDVGNLSRLNLVAEVLDNPFPFRLVDNAGDIFCDGKVINVFVAKLIVTLILAHQQTCV